MTQLVRNILCLPRQGVDAAVSILDAARQAWPPDEVFSIHAFVLEMTVKEEIQTAALLGLAEYVDGILHNSVGHLPCGRLIKEVWRVVGQTDTAPGLTNAAIRASGPFMATMMLKGELSDHHVSAWGTMMHNFERSNQASSPPPPLVVISSLPFFFK